MEQDVGQKAPSAIRCIKTTSSVRPSVTYLSGQKAPSAIRCIKTSIIRGPEHVFCSQKAPSAIRCIKTSTTVRFSPSFVSVRKHLAP